MPSFAETLRKQLADVQREEFIRKEEERAPRRRPARTREPITGTLRAIRNKRVAIREAALRLTQIVMTYRKTTTNETKKYIVAPYSYRYRRTRAGIRKMFFAYDMKDRHIKGFVVRNIRNIVLTDRKFRPKWPVEIG